MESGYLRTALTLGLLSAVGPFAIDMYLSGLPAIGHALNASNVEVQTSLMAFVMAAGISQLFYGPLSDAVGRKPPLCVGLIVFTLASIGCALSTSIEMLIGFRILQGVGACASMVLPRAIVRDLFTGRDAVRMMGLLLLLFSISPILAPLAGSFLVATKGWRTIFWVIAVVGAMGLILTVLLLTETRAPVAGQRASWGRALGNYSGLLRDGHFIGLAAISGFAFGTFFIYLGNSSFVLIGHYGLTPTQYSFCFSLNAFAFIATAQVNSWLVRHFSLITVLRTSVAGVAVSALVLLALFAAGIDSLPTMAAILFVAYAFLGPIMPNAMVLGLEHHGEIAGTASALFATIQMFVSGGVMGLTGYFSNGDPLPMIIGIATTAACAAVITFLLLPAPRLMPAASLEAAGK